MRVCIALSVFSVGVELPKKYLWKHWRTIFMLLGPVMLWGWLITGLLIWALIPGIDYLAALMIAACVSPTDPILAQAVVGGPWAEKHVPAHIRHMLQCESGCNDGAAFPFLFLAYFLTVNRGEVGFPVGKWFYQTIAWEIIFGTFLGAVIGYLARKLIRMSEKYKLVDRESFVVQYLCLAIASMGLTVLVGSDDLLAAFACGSAFAWDGWFQKQTADSNFSSIVDLIFNIATFIYIGAEMPWKEFVDGDMNLSVGRLIGLSILVLVLKRIPIVLALWKFIPDVKTFHEAMFTGFFGPMGVGAIFMCTYGRILLPEHVNKPPQTPNEVLTLTIQPIVFFFVLSSVIVHGFSIPFFAFGKRAQSNFSRSLTTTTSIFPASEPSWVNRIRRFNTRATTGEKSEPDQEPGSVVQAMHQGYSGKPAGSDDFGEDGLSPEHPSKTSMTHDRHSSHNAFKLTDTIDDAEDANFTDGDDWDGEDTVETRRHKKRLEAEQKARMTEERDIADARGDGQVEEEEEDLEKQVDSKLEHGDTEYPQINEWIEGHNIVLEIIDKPLDEPQTIVVPLDDETYREIGEEQSPLRSFICKYEDKLVHALGLDYANKASELSIQQLRKRKLLKKVSSFAQRQRSAFEKKEKMTEQLTKEELQNESENHKRNEVSSNVLSDGHSMNSADAETTSPYLGYLRQGDRPSHDQHTLAPSESATASVPAYDETPSQIQNPKPMFEVYYPPGHDKHRAADDKPEERGSAFEDENEAGHSRAFAPLEVVFVHPDGSLQN